MVNLFKFCVLLTTLRVQSEASPWKRLRFQIDFERLTSARVYSCTWRRRLSSSSVTSYVRWQRTLRAAPWQRTSCCSADWRDTSSCSDICRQTFKSRSEIDHVTLLTYRQCNRKWRLWRVPCEERRRRRRETFDGTVDLQSVSVSRA